jgi:hypothetical protein
MSETLNLNENSTPEEIKAYADQIAAEVKSEQTGEEPTVQEKSDSEIVSDHANNDKPEESLLDADDLMEDVIDKFDNEENQEGPSWLTEELRSELADYGFDESEINDFKTREELDRALRLVDKKALEIGQKTLAEEEKPQRNEKGQFQKNPKSESSYKVSLDPDLYDEELVSEFEKMKDFYEERIGSLEAKFSDIFEKAEEQEFDTLVDSLKMPELFGVTGKENEEELDRRRSLNVAMKAQMIGLEQLGRTVDMSSQLVSRVARMVFADEISKQELKDRTRKISKKSDLRQGGGATRTQAPSESTREYAERLYREMERG